MFQILKKKLMKLYESYLISLHRISISKPCIFSMPVLLLRQSQATYSKLVLNFERKKLHVNDFYTV